MSPPSKNSRHKKFDLFGYLFGFRQLVTRTGYFVTGSALMLVKYVTEAIVIWTTTGRVFTPPDFLNPLLVYRQQFFEPPAPGWLLGAVLVWSLPFLWILVSMSVRRAWHAGWHGITGMLVLIPILNYAVILALCLKPGKKDDPITRLDPFRTGQKLPESAAHTWRSALLGVTAGIVLSLVTIFLSVFALRDYGGMLFFGAPVVVGFVITIVYNHPCRRGMLASQALTQVAVMACGLVVVMVAIEGVVCVVMLWPIAAALACLGSIIGYAISAAGDSTARALVVAAMTFPALAGIDAFRETDQLFEVRTTIEIEAPPDVVWEHVVSFSEIDGGPDWLFQLGVAMPLRATIAGTGVGAVRYCEFTTGPFVEPITAWEPGQRLAFDVRSQPPPMTELSPYRHIHPPHLDHYLRSRRGEFRLTDLGQGRTRLEGSTWYELDIHPQDYWILWSDWCIHRIHDRVLTHIRDLSESAAADQESAAGSQ